MPLDFAMMSYRHHQVLDPDARSVVAIALSSFDFVDLTIMLRISNEMKMAGEIAVKSDFFSHSHRQLTIATGRVLL